jgi:multiple antibiotic resistance protein
MGIEISSHKALPIHFVCLHRGEMRWKDLNPLILMLVDPIYRFLGKRGSMVVTRVFAVIVAAFAVQYIVEGVRQISITLL